MWVCGKKKKRESNQSIRTYESTYTGCCFCCGTWFLCFKYIVSKTHPIWYIRWFGIASIQYSFLDPLDRSFHLTLVHITFLKPMVLLVHVPFHTLNFEECSTDYSSDLSVLFVLRLSHPPCYSCLVWSATCSELYWIEKIYLSKEKYESTCKYAKYFIKPKNTTKKNTMCIPPHTYTPNTFAYRVYF